MSSPRQQSKRELALDLCHKLLDDLDAEKISASASLLRLTRIAQLSGDSEVLKHAKSELDGFAVIGESPDDMKRQLRDYKGKEKFTSEEIDKALKSVWGEFPDYRRLSFAREYGSGFKTVYLNDGIAKYEELLERIRKDTKTRYTFSSGDETVYLTAAELNKLVAGVKRWVYDQVSSIQERLEFGQIPLRAIENTFEFVDTQLFDLIPDAAERLLVAYRNLAEKSEENWVNVVDTCRRVIKDFADAVFPPSETPVEGVIVTDDKYLNRIRAYVKQTVSSRRQQTQLDSVLTVLGELLARTDNLASRSVHAGKVSRFEAERVLIYTYLSIGDILVLSGQRERPDANTSRLNLNRATIDEMMKSLGLTKAVATAVALARKHRPFQSWDEVAQVKGIGPQTLQRIQEIASL